MLMISSDPYYYGVEIDQFLENFEFNEEPFSLSTKLDTNLPPYCDATERTDSEWDI